MANSVDVMRLNILSSGLLDPIGTSKVKILSTVIILHCVYLLWVWSLQVLFKSANYVHG